MPKKKTIQETIREFQERHGNKYDYSKAIYINSKTKIKVICRVHGFFEVTPNHHKRGVGCRKCFFEKQKIGLREFIQRSKEIFSERFDYSDIKEMPIDKRGKVSIKCNLHEVNFKQEPRNHLKGHIGCKTCISLKLSGDSKNRGKIKSQIELTDEFILKAKKKHNFLYGYSKVTYKSGSAKVVIKCEIHGDFEQSPSNHIRGNGCPKCAIESKKKRTFKQKCKELGVNYHRALKRRQAGHSEEKIFSKSYIRHSREINPIEVFGKKYSNLKEAVRDLKPPANIRTIKRWLDAGENPEKVFTEVPNPGYSNGIIYLVKNLVNNKKYVGLTVQSIYKRWEYHIQQANRGSIKNKDSLHAAIRKFGPEKFTVVEIDKGTAKDNLEEKEIYWIKQLNTIIPIGYNISKGGVSGGSNKKKTIVDDKIFPSVKEATIYVAKTRNISLHAAKWRILKGKLDLKSRAKKGESLVKTKTYKAWSRIVHGVINPKSKEYIQGIDIFSSWLDFNSFFKDVGHPLNDNMAFTRLDKSKGYYPNNCKWLDKSKSSKINAQYMKEMGKLVKKNKR